ncbi:hypothetical protein BV25DRAFT_1833472 [Artomyces pyxidatus]|uniref:Uncharacterized protein n=1 Tax=Artomyces pyxidatus TaxID=48021 RepID=A0ACB8SEL3_9AGAM|nr:hypothetical protein BV25DRAFT_1833472 [Artomyces pyxidatus]
MLVDFDLAGREGEAQYLPMINDGAEIKWAAGVRGAGLITKQHDLDMLEILG